MPLPSVSEVPAAGRATVRITSANALPSLAPETQEGKEARTLDRIAFRCVHNRLPHFTHPQELQVHRSNGETIIIMEHVPAPSKHSVHMNSVLMVLLPFPRQEYQGTGKLK